MWPDVSPFFQRAPRDRLKYQASPVAMVRASASAFMCATIRTSPEPASVATQVTRPSASNLGVRAKPSSRSEAVPGGANDMLLDIAVLQSLHWPARRGSLAAPCQYLYNVQPATRPGLNSRSCHAQRGL